MKRKILGILLALAMITTLVVPMAVSAATVGATGSVTVSYAPLSFNTGMTSDANPVTGSLSTSFAISTFGVGGVSHTLGLAGTTSANLASSTGNGYAFKLNADSTQQAALVAYFGGKGWTSDMITQIDNEIAGNAPFFYLKYDGTTYSLLDGFKVARSIPNTAVTVDDDYPVGTYVYGGTLTGTAATGNATLPITVTLVISQYSFTVVSPVAFTSSPTSITVGGSFTLTGTTTVHNSGSVAINGYSVSNFAFTAPSGSVAMTIQGGAVTGTTPLAAGADGTVTFTINCTAGSAVGTINLTGLTFALTPIDYQ